MDIKKLAEATGQPPRNIRFLISQGVVPSPEGSRRFPEYGEAHMKALSVYAKAKAEGIGSLDFVRRRVADALGGSRIETVEISPGVELRLDVSGHQDINLLKTLVAQAVERSAIGKETGQ